MKRNAAVLLSGGIGDFLHYLAKIDDFMCRSGIGHSAVTFYVESTRPSQVQSLFASALGEFDVRFVPAMLHWTRTNPLLVPQRKSDRVNRPAYRYVVEQGHDRIVDWFLPFLCTEYRIDRRRLKRIIEGRSKFSGRYVVVSLRDKGFLWWPRQAVCKTLQTLLPADYEVVYVGTLDETVSWVDGMVTFANVSEALVCSYHADIFIGTDTGLATIRELTGKGNIYCVDEYWFREFMIKYGYWCEQLSRNSESIFVYTMTELLDALSSHFDAAPYPKEGRAVGSLAAARGLRPSCNRR